MANDDELLLEDDLEPNIDVSVKSGRLTAAEAQANTLREMESQTTRIILEENDEIPPIGLFLGLNGKGFLIQPGVEVDVPNGLIDILNNASMSAPIVDPQTQQISGWRDRLRYPYRVVRKRV